MGILFYPVEIGDPDGQRFERMDALVDTGASYTTLPASILERLNVQPIRQMRFILADGSYILRNLGRTWVRAEGRQEITIVVFGDEDTTPLLGAYALEGLGLGVDPVNQRLIEVDGFLL